MFIKQAFKYDHEFWRYLVGSLIIFAFAFIGQMPFTVAVILEKLKDGSVDFANLKLSEKEMYSALEPNLNLFLIMLSFVFAFVGIIIALRVHSQPLKTITTTRKKVDWKRILLAFTIWGVISSTMTFLDYNANPDNYDWNFNLDKFLILFGIAIILIPIQTSVEEWVFRGYLMQGFGWLAKNRWFPLVMTSVIFGLLHIANPEVTKLGYGVLVFYIGTGLFLGIITLMDDGLELALGFHAANNLFTALLVTSDWTALQTHSVLKDISEPGIGLYEIALPVFIMFPLLIFIFSRIYKWDNWNEKLFGSFEEPREDYKILD